MYHPDFLAAFPDFPRQVQQFYSEAKTSPEPSAAALDRGPLRLAEVRLDSAEGGQLLREDVSAADSGLALAELKASALLQSKNHKGKISSRYTGWV